MKSKKTRYKSWWAIVIYIIIGLGIIGGIIFEQKSVYGPNISRQEVVENVTIKSSDTLEVDNYVSKIKNMLEKDKSNCLNMKPLCERAVEDCGYLTNDSGYEDMKSGCHQLDNNCLEMEMGIEKVDYEFLKLTPLIELKEIYWGIRKNHFSIEEAYTEFLLSTNNQIALCKKNKPFEMNEPVIAGNFKWKITGITKQSEIGEDFFGNFMGTKANGEYLIISVEVENIGKSAQYLTNSFIKLIDNQGREFSSDAMAGIYLKPQGSSLNFETINPGIVRKGKVVFDVPKGLNIIHVKISDSLIESSFYTVKLIS